VEIAEKSFYFLIFSFKLALSRGSPLNEKTQNSKLKTE